MGRSTRSHPYGALWVALLFLGLAVSPIWAMDWNLSAIVWGTATDNRGLESDNLEQRYSFSLSQRFTPYLSLQFAYQFFDFATQFETGQDFTRRNQEPRLDILYNRGRFSGLFSYRKRFNESSADPNNYTADTILANLSWRSSHGFGFVLNFQDQANVADEAVFGRNTDTRLFQGRFFYDRTYWRTSYTYGILDTENTERDFKSDQDRHDLRLNASRRFLDNKVGVGFTGSVGRIDRQSFLGEGVDPADPIPARAGLFRIDTSPELGELLPNPDLIDGDIQSPTDPEILIGGANTFRNIGVDLGFTLPASRLEIYVDTVSSPDLAWRVYESRDNLVWDPVGGVSSEFDQALLRYTLRFPETTNRYFKAVNVSSNAIAVVRVTEIRALRDLDVEPGQDEFRSNIYRAAVSADFKPHERVAGNVDVTYSNDEDLANGFVRRDYVRSAVGAGLSAVLARNLNLRLGYQLADVEDRRDPVIIREQEILSANLAWTPLPTLEAVLTASQRDESDENTLLQSAKSARLRLLTVLLPDLRLASDFEYARLEDPFTGFDRDSWTWTEGLTAEATRNWSFGGRMSLGRYETREGEPLLNRYQLFFDTTWRATAFITLRGSWGWSDNNGQTNLSQTYNISYNPGPKLSISGVVRLFETIDENSTDLIALNTTYRLNQYFTLFGNLSRSRFAAAAVTGDEITSIRLGLRLTL